MALSPDGKYLAYSDTNGVHIRSIGTADSRVLSDTKGMGVRYWAADATQFFVSKLTGERYTFYSVSLPGGVPHALGDAMPSPGGQYSLRRSSNDWEVRRATDGKVYSLDRKDAQPQSTAWSPHNKRLVVIFRKLGGSGSEWMMGPYWIEALDPEDGRWTTLVSPQREYISGVVWLSDRELMYAKYEPAPRTDSNLWVLNVNQSTGLPSGAPQRRTQWTDFRIQDLSASVDRRLLCFTRSSVQENVYLGELQARGKRLDSLRRLTLEDASNTAFAWTPDSKAVLLMSDRDGQFHIYKQDIDKDVAELITSGPDNETVPRVSPDGQWLLYFLDDTLGRLKRRLMRIPLAGGAAQQILISAEAALYDCGHTAGGACVLAETRGKVFIFSLLDPIKGRGPKVLETALATGYPAISPDGQHIAFPLLLNRIRTIDLHGATEGEITLSGTQNLQYMEWSADGTGFFIADLQPAGTRLLHVERSGASQVLWTRRHGSDLGPIPSPNGRYLATNMDDENSNVWMVENP